MSTLYFLETEDKKERKHVTIYHFCFSQEKDNVVKEIDNLLASTAKIKEDTVELAKHKNAMVQQLTELNKMIQVQKTTRIK